MSFWVLFVFFVSLIIFWTSNHLGLRSKKNATTNGVLGFIIAALGVMSFFVLGISGISSGALRGDFIFLIGFLFSVVFICSLALLIKEIFIKKKIVLIAPSCNEVGDEEKCKMMAYISGLRKKKAKVYTYMIEDKNDYSLESLFSSVQHIFSADEVHIWCLPGEQRPIWLNLGIYLSYRFLFGHKRIVMVNGGYALLEKGELGKFLFGLEFSSFG
jgi:hypothetical protein